MLYKLIVKKNTNNSGYGDDHYVFENDHFIVQKVIWEFKERFNSFIQQEYGVYFSDYSFDKLVEGEIVQESIYEFELCKIDYISM